jgi:hypothetical protein
MWWVRFHPSGRLSVQVKKPVTGVSLIVEYVRQWMTGEARFRPFSGQLYPLLTGGDGGAVLRYVKASRLVLKPGRSSCTVASRVLRRLP